MLIISCKKFVPAIAAQRYRYMFSRMHAKYVYWYGRRVGKWFVYIVQHVIYMLQKVVIGKRKNRVIGFILLCYQLCVFGFIKKGVVFIAYREGIKLIGIVACQSYDDRRIYTSA